MVDGQLAHVRKWPTADSRGLGAAVSRYRRELEQAGEEPRWDAGAVAVAGPVEGERAGLTNVPGWGACVDDIAAPGVLLNDLAAVAWALDDLAGGDLLHLCGPPPSRGAPAVVLGIGTGLGEALRIGRVVVPGEGGHADFAPPGPEHDALLAWLRERLPTRQVIWEHVLSGPGLGRLLGYAATRVEPVEEVARALAAADGPSPQSLVTEHRDDCPACGLALRLFVEAAAAETANQGLRVLATGGVYLCGGVAQLLADVLSNGHFAACMLDPEANMAHLRARLPVRLVVHPDPALVGTAAAARALLGR